MIAYALIVRSCDGMPLSASVENDDQPEVRDTKKYLKMLSKQVKRMEDRCSLVVNDVYVLHFMTTLGVSYMALCEIRYPVVLAFSFLDEVVKEFITTYSTHDVSAAPRPYFFLRFDGVVQKARQRYNHPSSLATKVNLADLSLEIRLRPPRQVSLSDILPLPNGTSISFPNTVGPAPQLTALTWLDYLSVLLSGCCATFNVVRGVTALSRSTFEEYDSRIHGILFLTEATLQCAQVFLLLNPTRRHLWTCWIMLLLCMCNVAAFAVRDVWQILLHAAVSFATTFRTTTRRPERKTANYNV